MANRFAEIAIHEFKEIIPPTIFFGVGFNLIVFTQRIVLANYLFQFAGFMVATVAALVVGKAVLVANKMPFLHRFDDAPLIRPILFRTVIYWAFVFIARLLEGYIHYMIDEGRVMGFFRFLLGGILVESLSVCANLDSVPVSNIHHGIAAKSAFGWWTLSHPVYTAELGDGRSRSGLATRAWDSQRSWRNTGAMPDGHLVTYACHVKRRT